MKVAYEIFHYRLQQPIHFLYSESPCLLIVWENERAIGDLWIEDGIQSEAIFLKNVQCIEDEYNRKKQHTQIVENVALSLSVVVCTRNRTEMLANCLHHLLQLNDTSIEIIVVDNAPSNEDTKLLVQQFPQIIYVRENRKGLDIARNTGAKLATKTIVAYTDDDVIVDKNWTHNIKRSFSDPYVMAVTGLILPVGISAKAQYIFEKYWSFNKGYQPLLFDKTFITKNENFAAPVWDIGAGANMAFRKDAFLLNGYFDERLDVGAAGCSGDSEYWYRLLANGWKCFYNPAAIVFHAHRDTMPALRKQLYNYMRGQVASLFVQYERFAHIGNLRRVYRALPAYYAKRLLQCMRGKHWIYNQTIFTEMAGAISGIFFYTKHKQKLPHKKNGLLEPVVATKESLVSIVITNYNYARYLEQAIRSCLDQTHGAIEIIVVDDGSTDNSLKIIESFPQVQLLQTNRVKLSAARNIGASVAKGLFILFLDADDYLPFDAIEKQLYFFRYQPQTVFVVGSHQKMDEKGAQLWVPIAKELEGNAYTYLLEGNFIGMEGAVLYRKEIFDCFSFDINLQSCEDYDLNLRIARYFPCIAHTEVVAVYRIHGGSMSGNKERMWQTVKQVLEKAAKQIQSLEEAKALKNGYINWKQLYEYN